MVVAFAVVLMVVATVGHLAIEAWVLVQLWGWFAVPLGMPALGFLHAAGVSLLISHLVISPNSEEPEKRTGQEALRHAGAHMLLRPALLLALGWAVHAMMGGA